MIRWKDKSRGIPETPDETQKKAAFETLKQALHNDPGYAWSWHCNVAVSFMDEGGSLEHSNRASARFMRTVFDVDVTSFDQWKSLGMRDCDPATYDQSF